MKRLRLRRIAHVIVGSLFLLVAACASPVDADDESRDQDSATHAECVPSLPPFSGTRALKFQQADGSTRIARVKIPRTLDPREPAPVIVAFHGFGGTSASIFELMRIDELAEASEVVLVAPQGRLSEFDRAGWGMSAAGAAEDAAFVDQVMSQVDSMLCIDPHRVFAMGYSNGSVFAQKYACREASPIVAVSGVAGMLVSDECAAGPVPLIYFHGTSDTIAPFEGGETLIGTLDGVEESLTAWARMNGCGVQDAITNLEAHVERRAWLDCPDGAEVRAYITTGGGHRWPGGYLEAWKPAHGTLETDLDATMRSWRFFERAGQGRERRENTTS